jgi:hypothetical protein
MYDMALVGDEATGKMVLHTADCPVARQAVADGHPALTMYECKSFPDQVERHACWEKKYGR